MSTKINPNYYGAENTFVTLYTDLVKTSQYTIANLITNGTYTGGDLDHTATPWGVGRSSVSSDFQSQLTKGATWTIFENKNQRKNTPLWFYYTESPIVGADTPSDIVGTGRTSTTFARALYKNRYSPAVTIDDSNIKSSLTVDNNANVELTDTNTLKPVTYLNYSGVRVCLRYVYYKTRGEGDFKRTSFVNFYNNNVNANRVFGFDFTIRNTAGDILPIYVSIGGSALDIPDVYKQSYYGKNNDKWVRPWRNIQSVGYWNMINLSWATFTTDTGCIYSSVFDTLNSDDNAAASMGSSGWGHISDTPQTFDDISYHWEYGYSPITAEEWKQNPIKTGDACTSGVYRSFAQLNLDDGATLNNDNLAKAILHEIAFLGLPFCFSTSKATAAIGSDDIYLPVFDDHMVTTGDYVNGAASRALPNATWTDIFGTDMPNYDPDYDPDGGEDTPIPDPGIGDLLPVGLNFTMAGRGTGIWALRPTDIDEIWNDIFGADIKIDMFGNNPMNAILSLKWTPFEWNPVGDEEPIVLGDQVVNPLHDYPIIATLGNAEQHGWGSVRFDFDKNFYNARHMQARLFLPFYGYYELPAAQLLNAQLRVDFYYNVPDELGVWFISYKQNNSEDWVVYDYCECSIDIDVPLTGSNAAEISASRKAEALSIATQAAAMAVATIAGVSGASIVGGEIGAIFSGAGSVGGVLSSLPWLEKGTTFALATGIGRLATGASGVGGGLTNLSNTLSNARIQRADLRTNLPYHGSALQTTFLHLSMVPYIQIFKNGIIEGLDTENTGTVKEKLGGTTEAQYKLKVGHACDIWNKITDMPENSLLQTTGMADMDTTGMELAEVQELNSILINGFYYTSY